MKKYLIPIIIILGSILSGSALKDNKIPNSRIKMLNGEYAKLSDFNQDGPMIVNFWTTWWPYCERQLGFLDQINSSFSKTGLKVLTVNANKPQIVKQVRPYINKRKYKFDVSLDPTFKLADKFGVKGFPSYYLVDKNGKVIHESAGYSEGIEEEYLKELKKYLTSQNIEFKDFEYQKKDNNKKEAISIDF